MALNTAELVTGPPTREVPLDLSPDFSFAAASGETVHVASAASELAAVPVSAHVEHLGVAATFDVVSVDVESNMNHSGRPLGFMRRLAERARGSVPARRALAGLAVVALLGAGCGGPAEAQEQACFTQMSPQQIEELTAYTNQNPDVVKQNTNNTQDVCVLEQGQDGSYEAHHYNQQRDNFDNLLLYSMLSGQSRSLATFAYFNDDISPSQLIALSLLTDIGPRGDVYSPYGRQSDGKWARNVDRVPAVINNKTINVTNVQYGNNPAVPLAAAAKAKPPKGYKKPATVPKAKPNSVGQSAPGGKVKPAPSKKAAGNNVQNPSTGKPTKGGKTSTGKTSTGKTGGKR